MLFGPPRIWRNEPILLYHGTIRSAVASIGRGIDLRNAEPFRDFGKGFYTTTVRRQAETWAMRKATKYRGRERPAVVAFEAERDALASLDTLAFVRGDYDADDFWSLVWRCRQTDVDHGRSSNGGWYDVVVGPVSAFWRQRLAVGGASDQISFHTDEAVGLLNRSFQWEIIW